MRLCDISGLSQPYNFLSTSASYYLALALTSASLFRVLVNILVWPSRCYIIIRIIFLLFGQYWLYRVEPRSCKDTNNGVLCRRECV